MWSASEESSGAMEEGPPEAAVIHTKETCEQNKNQLESLKEIMMRNQQSLKKKEEEVQEYAQRLSKIKSRAKLSRRSKEGASSSKDPVHSHKAGSTAKDITVDTIDDISQAKTPKAKSSLLQRKLVENRKAFEQRSKELTETKRAVEEKVEAIRQQLEETDLAVAEIHKDQLAIKPLGVISDDIQEKEHKIMELSNKILELEATVLDLQENLKEKDSVIDSKMKAVTLMSADLSKKGKTTLDTLEDTKDEMRTMQENFILIETSLRNKNASLLEQLQERDNRISDLEHTIVSFEEQLKEQKTAESVRADFSRSAMDTLAETKDAMKSMQENFVLIESSLKLKNDNLLRQLEEYEMKLAEAKERIFQLETGAGITTAPPIEDLLFKMEKLEQNNRQLLDEKYELQKNVAEMQDQIIASSSACGNDAIMEKDNRISELEDLVKELEQSNKSPKEESKTELQKQITELSSKNEEYSKKITDFEKQVHKLETEKNETAARLSDERTMPTDNKVIKLTKELEELNKSMIKLKAQHRSKLKNLQKQLENFKMVSDTNAELVRLGNQVALLEEEKGNLQLSLVDFDELKASAGDWQERLADLENKVSSQTKEIQTHIDAIAILENQKLDLMQDLHTIKQEVSALEAENAESENLRVTAEMKIVELEEQLEAIHKQQSDNKLESLSESEYKEFLKKIEALTQENSELYNKLNRIEEKGTSDTGSTESFEAIQVNDRNDLLKKIEDLEQKNNELTLKLTKSEEKDSSHAGSTESFETINDTDRSELLKKIEQLTQENSDLTMKLSKIEEKGSSDTGSTESFERIPEHNESMMKIESLIQENNELVIKLTKLEEHLNQMESNVHSNVSKTGNTLEMLDDAGSSRLQIDTVRRENDNFLISNLKTQMEDLAEENSRLRDRVKVSKTEDIDSALNDLKLEANFAAETSQSSQVSVIESALQITDLTEEQRLEREFGHSRECSMTSMTCATDDMKSKIAELEKENAQMMVTIARLEERINSQKEEMSKMTREKEESSLKREHTAYDNFAKERLELIDKLEKLNREKQSVAQERQELHEQINTLLQRSSDEISGLRTIDETVCQEPQIIIASLEKELENSKVLIADYKNQMEEMNMKQQSMEVELQEKDRQLIEYGASGTKLESLERELKGMLATAEEWKFKYDDMQVNVQALEKAKTSMEEAFRTLENGNIELLQVIREKDATTFTLQEQFQGTIELLEARLQSEIANVTTKEHEISNLRGIIESKDQELHTKYMQLQNEMIAIDNLQDELNNYKIKLKESEDISSSSAQHITELDSIIKQREEEIHTLRNNVNAINKALEQSKPLAEFDEISESLRNKEISYIDLQNQHDDLLREKIDLLQKIEDVSKRNDDIRDDLIEKEQDIENLLAAKESLNAQIKGMKDDRSEAENRIWELQAITDNQTAYIEKVQSDLTNEYKQMEQLKVKHTEDMVMLNRRLEDVIDELNSKIQENEAMKVELEQKDEFGKTEVEQSSHEEIILEQKIAELEQKLAESENKLQTQSEKMKKIVATFNKKKIACQELEARVAELEEKWTTEKDEKEVKNKKMQEVKNSMQEKDDKIADLEEKLLQTKSEIAETLASSEKHAKESISLKEKMTVLMEQIAEMGEEIERQRAEIERVSFQITTERTTREKLAKEYDLYKRSASEKDEQKQTILDEVKEEARELSVRMQVMESEYLEQLALIKNLQTENGLLSSKQAQINEKLENTEKESEERRTLIEHLQRKVATTVTAAIQVPEEDSREDGTRVAQHCDHSEQCQNLVQALEARLQERQAEIENLNNELANSYGNIVLLHDESLRYNDMMMQTAQERFNQSLMGRTNMLQQEIDSLKREKIINEQRISELVAELGEYQRKNAVCEADIPGITEISVDNQQQQQQKRDDTPRLFDASKIFGSIAASDADASDKKEIARLQSILGEKESQCSEHLTQINLLHRNIQEERSYVQKLQAQCDDQARHWRNQYEDVRSELKKAECLLLEKNAQVGSLSAELDKVATCTSELKSLQEQCYTAQVESERLGQLVIEKNAQIDSLITELNSTNQRMNAQFQQYTDVEAGLRTDLANRVSEISLKDIDIAALRTELTSAKDIAEALTKERDQQSRILESYRNQIDNLDAEVRNANDNHLIREWEERISATVAERDLLQLQANDLKRSLEESEESLTTRHIELENALRERDQAQALVADLMDRALEDSSRQNLQGSMAHEDDTKKLVYIGKPTTRQEFEQVSGPVEEAINQQERIQKAQVSAESEVQETQLDIDLSWDNDSERFNIDEDSWGWNAESAQLIGDQRLASTTTLIPNTEMQLRAQVRDLQDGIKDQEAQNAIMAEENKAMQAKTAKLVKKLKEYKVQIESLQQQLKTQKQTDSFFDLDKAIEEELKTQVAELEKTLKKITEEKRNIIAEKETLLKRFDVIVSANERYMEMKEKQDMEVEVLRIQNKELGDKVQSLEWRLQGSTGNEKDKASLLHCEDQQIDLTLHEIDTTVAYNRPRERSAESNDDLKAVSSKYKEEIDDLKDELEALAAENEQLQHFLEEQKETIANLESKGESSRSDTEKLTEKFDGLNDRNVQLQSVLNKSKEEYDVLRKQYEQCLMDANDQVAAMRRNNDLVEIEFSQKVDKLESEVNNLQRALEEKEGSEGKINALACAEEKLSTVNASLTEVTELLNDRVQEVADLRQELQNQYVERQQAEAALQSEIQSLSKELDDKKQELGTLSQAFNDKEHELVQQRGMETANAIVGEATQELVQKHAIEIEEKDKELRDLTERLMTLQMTIDEKALKLRDSVAKLEMQQQQIAYLKEDLKEQNSIMEAIKINTNTMNAELHVKQQELAQCEQEKSKFAVKLEKSLADIQHLQSLLKVTETITVDLQECRLRTHDLEQQVQVLKSEKESILLQYDQETTRYQARLESGKRQIDALKQDTREKTEQLHYLNTQLCSKENDLEGIRAMMIDKDSLLETTSQELSEKRAELEKLRNEQSQSSKTIDGLPVFRMGNDDNADLQKAIDELKTQMEVKQQELEHLKYVLSENTYPAIIQQMQDRINCLYNEKATLEASLRSTTQSLTEKQEQVSLLTQRINGQNQGHISKEEVGSLPRDRRSAHDQEEIVRLQNELHVKEQEINELKYVIAEKDSQLSLQASMEPQSDDFELRETVQRLTGELYGKEQEAQTLKLAIAELEEEVSRLKDFEKLSEESRRSIERLTSEKELIRIEAEELLNRELQSKEAEIDEIKQRLSEENQKLSAELRLRDSDVENLKMQLLQSQDNWNNRLQQKDNELIHTTYDLAEKERRLAELSITKDAELHNLRVQIREKEERIEELLVLSAEEEKQLDELRQTLTARETEMITLKNLLEQKISEYELIQHALRKDVSVIEAATSRSLETDVQVTDNKETVSSKLDLALYMLHQRDIRCEELTHELMQLLEERDTLQLRLSNAIRINEELRRTNGAETSPTKDTSSALGTMVEPVVEQPSPSKSEGPIEIAKEAIDVPIEDKEALALKLSQLHSISHTKDVRLKDERELRHTQQMSLLAHRDVLSTLPPEAAARLVNANYTLSRDVQSQSSILLNWLWGKSTPKVVHM